MNASTAHDPRPPRTGTLVLMERGWRSGPRLPVAPSPEPNRVPCDRDNRHTGGIRFELRRYGRTVGVIRLCGDCFNRLNPNAPPDPLFVEEDAA